MGILYMPYIKSKRANRSVNMVDYQIGSTPPNTKQLQLPKCWPSMNNLLSVSQTVVAQLNVPYHNLLCPMTTAQGQL